MKVLHVLIYTAIFCVCYCKNFSGRIIGGNLALTGQFPFAVAITITKPDGQYFCSGTLITNQWILTSGHCVDNALLFTIQMGSNILSGSDPYRVTASTSDYALHPEFDADLLQNDIGLIKLRTPVEYSDYLRQIRFMPTFRLQDGAPTIAIGWGQTSDEESGLSNELQNVNLTSISNEECRFTYGSQITDSMVCVIGNYNEGTCIGDMDGPLLQHVGRGYYLNVGVASFISSNGCESLNPSGYTRTFSYMDWMRNVTGNL